MPVKITVACDYRLFGCDNPDHRGQPCWYCTVAELRRRGGDVEPAGYRLADGRVLCFERLVEALREENANADEADGVHPH